MKYRMVVSDFDDTLLSSAHTVSTANLKAIKEYERAGGKFVIATGRMLNTILATVAPFGLTGEIIAFQGGVVADVTSGEVLMKKYLDSAAAYEILDDIRNFGYYVQAYANGRYYINRMTERTKYYTSVNNLQPIVVGEDVAGYFREKGLQFDKIVFGLNDRAEDDDYAEVEKTINFFNNKYAGRVIFNTSNILLIEAVSAGCTKGEAVKFVADRNGISREQVICVGDALNDLSMIEWAGLGVAVSNAPQGVKDRADAVTVSCNEDAIARVIHDYCL